MVSQFGVVKGMVSGILQMKNVPGYNGWEINIDAMCAQYEAFKNYRPRCFARAPRSLKEFINFKATEFRQFALYGAIVLLKQYLSEALCPLPKILAYRIISRRSRKSWISDCSWWPG